MKVGGVNCEITQKTDNLVTCVAPNNAEMQFQNQYPGSRGVIVEVYEGLADAAEIDGVSYDDYTGRKMDIDLYVIGCGHDMFILWYLQRYNISRKFVLITLSPIASYNCR